ncbi:hypothetical protein FNW54_05490 [Bacteroides sp. HF-5092]|nr:hypothetical protein FNW54_05490 [Bacteroides sp. HF-5092]
MFHCFCTFGIKLCKYSNYIKNEELRVKIFWKWRESSGRESVDDTLLVRWMMLIIEWMMLMVE